MYAIARTESKLDALREATKDKKGKMIPIICDLQDLTSVSKAADSVIDQLGKNEKIDFLVNNAGMHYGAPWKTHSIDIASKTDGMDKVKMGKNLSYFSRSECPTPFRLASLAAAFRDQLPLPLPSDEEASPRNYK